MFGWTIGKTQENRRIAETTGAYDGGAVGVMTGLTAHTKVASSMGWRKVGALTEGDKVLTFDAGLQPLTKITRQSLWTGEQQCPRRFWPLEVPQGALGNRDVMRLLPNQGVMIESDAAEAVYGDAFTLIPAGALEGVNDIKRVTPAQDDQVFILHFENDQVVFGNSGALFFCPTSRDLLECALDPETQSSYRMLPMLEARVLARELEGRSAAFCDAEKNKDIVAA